MINSNFDVNSKSRDIALKLKISMSQLPLNFDTKPTNKIRVLHNQDYSNPISYIFYTCKLVEASTWSSWPEILVAQPSDFTVQGMVISKYDPAPIVM